MLARNTVAKNQFTGTSPRCHPYTALAVPLMHGSPTLKMDVTCTEGTLREGLRATVCWTVWIQGFPAGRGGVDLQS